MLTFFVLKKKRYFGTALVAGACLTCAVVLEGVVAPGPAVVEVAALLLDAVESGMILAPAA